MIKENELRIGNRLLYHINEDGIEWDICTIDWHDLKWISQDQEGFNEKHKPIPLTEEVLKAWGFEPVGYGRHHSLEFKGFRNGLYDIYLLENECITFMNNVTEKSITNIKYLHQLQTIYFALTGEELKPIK